MRRLVGDWNVQRPERVGETAAGRIRFDNQDFGCKHGPIERRQQLVEILCRAAVEGQVLNDVYDAVGRHGSGFAPALYAASMRRAAPTAQPRNQARAQP